MPLNPEPGTRNPEPHPADNLRWAATLLDGAVAAGLRHLVLSPGSRSTPPALAALRDPRITAWVRLDERTAAFFALGLARASASPVGLVATSGSAPAHWYPAVIEASHSGVPLLLLSADRPAELHGCGANQTTDQRELFGPHVRAFHQLPHPSDAAVDLAALRDLAVAATHRTLAPRPGPVHLNLPLREPLLPPVPRPLEPGPAAPLSIPAALPPPDQLERLAARLAVGRGMIVCGPDDYPAGFAEAVAALAERLAAPLLADPLSGLRFGPAGGRVLTRYDAFLRAPAWREADPDRSARPDWIVRFGAAPVSKPLLDYLGRCDAAEQVGIDPRQRGRDPTRRVGEWIAACPRRLCREVAARLPAAAPAAQWLGQFRAAEARAAGPAGVPAPPEAAVVEGLIAALPAGATLFSGNSMPIRDLDAFSGSGTKPLRIVANRGVSGIDGNLATLLGLAAGRAGPVVGLLGDLAFWHDHAALLECRGIEATVVVVNNGGGGIFEYLPQRGLPEFETGWLTPVHAELAGAARLYGLDYARCDPAGLRPALEGALGRPGVKLVEVTVVRAESVAAHRAYWAAVAGQAG